MENLSLSDYNWDGIDWFFPFLGKRHKINLNEHHTLALIACPSGKCFCQGNNRPLFTHMAGYLRGREGSHKNIHHWTFWARYVALRTSTLLLEEVNFSLICFCIYSKPVVEMKQKMNWSSTDSKMEVIGHHYSKMFYLMPYDKATIWGKKMFLLPLLLPFFWVPLLQTAQTMENVIH